MTFDEWFDEQEGFGLRCERFAEDFAFGGLDRMKQWLKAAYEQGYEEGLKGIPLGF